MEWHPVLLAHPIRWFQQLDLGLPEISDDDLEPGFGPGSSRRLKSWGHDLSGAPSVHWLSTRSGTAMHTDIAYIRYTHHLILRNDGFKIIGPTTAGDDHPPMRPGALYCLDTHVEHQVLRDPRLGWAGRGYKVQIAVDRPEPLEPAAALDLLIDWTVRDHALALLSAGRPPRPRKAT